MSEALTEAKRRLRLRDLWDLAPYPATPPDRNGIVRVNPLREDRHPSFSVAEEGRVFCDFGREGVKGGLWEFVALCRPDWSKAQIAAELVKRAGLEGRDGPSPRRRRSPSAPPPAAPTKAVVMPWPDAVRMRWEEGLALLRTDAARQAKIAAKRGWPVEVVATLAELGLIAYPRLPWRDDRRGTAFLVEAPKRRPGGGVELMAIGYHQRFWIDGDGSEGARKAWCFCPSEKPVETRARWPLQFEPQATPALPFVIGDVARARVIVILEGQWDAATFAHAAGMLWDGFELPLACLGIRGNNGVRPFFEHYLRARVWAEPPAAWVIRDNDAAGATWAPTESWLPGKSFSEQLAPYCSKVVVSSVKLPGTDAKDFNDAWRVKRWGPADILAAMRSLGLEEYLRGGEAT